MEKRTIRKLLILLTICSYSTRIHGFLVRPPSDVHFGGKVASPEDDRSVKTAVEVGKDTATRIELDAPPYFARLDTLVDGSVAAPLPEQSYSPTEVTMSPLESWCLSHLDDWYRKSQSIKCPFMRRRLGDVLDNVESAMKHTIIRRECWPLMGPKQACRPPGVNKRQQLIKYKGLSVEARKAYIKEDWKPDSGKGYYITGKLTTALYRDDCRFLGPDPDMPITGLRKYVGVAAHLFDTSESSTILKSLETDGDTIVAKWQLQGILRLPWRPSLPTFSGTTTYFFDEEGLIEKHEESWDISVNHAFCHTLFPDIAKHIWGDGEEQFA